MDEREIHRAVERLVSAFHRGDPAEWAKLVHPEAVIERLSTGERLRTRDQHAAYALDGRDLLAVPLIRNIEVEGDVALLSGRIQYQHPDHSLIDRASYWVIEFNDGLLYRSRNFTTEVEARTWLNLLLARQRSTLNADADSRCGPDSL
jgi:hypothetical protein